MKVLFVCTGNICRSPTAEGLFLHHAARRGLDGRVRADSAGVSDEEAGNPIDARAVACARARGIRLGERRARRVADADFDDHDLILGMTAVHLTRLEAERPHGARARLGVLLDHAPQVGVRDVPDPWWGGGQDFERAFDLIEAGITGLLDDVARRLGQAL
ncbi:MAG: low molecular weight phosphotyrosine protein phosphatase [Alphaproteobacteria bacterium]|jgi:protein-tyrosine phosphatase|nr:low molecular weight phosphotyrosine protein phosphatase [Alphaproteobacteria bacterium]